MSNTLKKIIVPVVIAALLFAGYNFFLKGDGSDSLLNVTTATPDDALGTEIIRAINQISTLKLDRSIFDDPIFSTLVDRSEEIAPEKTGRANPFAVIGSSNSTSTNSVKTATTSTTTRPR
jgi:hypothetical protein